MRGKLGFYMEQARLRLPFHAHPNGRTDHQRKLERTERAENFLFSLGFTAFRIRMSGTAAKLQIPASQMEKVLKNRVRIVRELKQYYSAVTLDLEARNE